MQQDSREYLAAESSSDRHFPMWTRSELHEGMRCVIPWLTPWSCLLGIRTEGLSASITMAASSQ